MNKQEFMEIIKTFDGFNSLTERLKSCQAWVKTGYLTLPNGDTTGCYMLVSYTTYVACIIPNTKTMYVFDYYSATTSQHCAKFFREYCARRVCYLYKRSDHTGYIDYTKKPAVRLTYKQLSNKIPF